MMVKLPREYYFLADAAKEIGCSLSDLLHAAARGRIKVGYLMATGRFDPLLEATWRTDDGVQHVRLTVSPDSRIFASISKCYVQEIEAVGTAEINVAAPRGERDILFSDPKPHLAAGDLVVLVEDLNRFKKTLDEGPVSVATSNIGIPPNVGKQQSETIIACLRELHINPMAYRNNGSGNPGARAECWKALKKNGKSRLFRSDKAYERLWDRMKERGELREETDHPQTGAG
jgi:hypothetical protein